MAIKIYRSLRAVFATEIGRYWLFVALLLIPNVFLVITEPFRLATAAASLVLPAGVYMLWMLVARRPGVMALWAFPVMFLCAFQLVIMYLFGGSIIAVDMFTNLFTTNASEAGELLGSIMPAVVGVCVIYIPTIIIACFSAFSGSGLTTAFRRRMARYGASTLGVGVLLALVAGWTSPRFGIKYHIFPASVVYNLDFTIKQWNKSMDYPETSADFRFDAIRTDTVATPEVYILVIGEASRAADWSLFGYDRQTTPRLEATRGLAAFRDVFTQNNATHKSVPLILSAVDATNFNDVYGQKSLITAFAESGFRTLFISNQVPNRSLIDYFAAEADSRIDLSPNDNTLFKENKVDGDMLPYISSAVAENRGKLLIVLHTYGSHFNFYERYPRDFARFAPDFTSSVNPQSRDIVRNAYDNSVAYTDDFLADVIEVLEQSGQTAAMLYSSDHGEDLMDDARGRFLHASPTPTYYQLHVAFFAWFSDLYSERFPSKVEAAALNRDKSATTSSVFHTIVDMAAISTSFLDPSKSVVSPEFTPQPKIYLNDHYEPTDIYDIGLKPLDFDMFDQHRISYDKTKVHQVIF